MTKPEPLKGKMHLVEREDGTYGYYRDFDVKSAVEWLKENLKAITHKGDWPNREKIIDEAFEDVMRG